MKWKINPLENFSQFRWESWSQIFAIRLLNYLLTSIDISSELSIDMQIDNRNVHVHPIVLFLRLIVLIERAEDTVKYFSYELTPIPTSIFKGNFMRHAEKSQMANAWFHYQRIKFRKRGTQIQGNCWEWWANKKKEKKKWWSAERDEQNKCEEEESTSHNIGKKVPQEWSQLMKMTSLHPSIQKSLWMEGFFFTEYFGKARCTKI